MGMARETSDDCHGLLFGIRRSIRYHSRRRLFFERFHQATTASSLILGSAAVAGFLAKNDWSAYAAFASALVAVISSVDLSIGTTQAARRHDDLARRFTVLEKEIVEAGPEITEDRVRKLNSARLDIEADEPPVLHVLNVICHNELARAMGYGPEEIVKVGRLQRWLANFWDIGEHKLSKSPAA